MFSQAEQTGSDIHGSVVTALNGIADQTGTDTVAHAPGAVAGVHNGQAFILQALQTRGDQNRDTGRIFAKTGVSQSFRARKTAGTFWFSFLARSMNDICSTFF